MGRVPYHLKYERKENIGAGFNQSAHGTISTTASCVPYHLKYAKNKGKRSNQLARKTKDTTMGYVLDH
jgi:hypothetical protein